MSIQILFYLFLSVLILYLLFTVGYPFLFALLVVLILEPLAQWLGKTTKLKRIYISTLLSTTFTFIFCGLGYLLISKGLKELMALSKTLLNYLKDNYDTLTQSAVDLHYYMSGLPFEVPFELQDLITASLDSLQALLGKTTEFILQSAVFIPHLAIDVLIFVIALYFLGSGLPSIKKSLLNFFAPESHKKIDVVLSKLYQASIGFLRAQIIISIFIFLVTLMGFFILGIRYALALSIIITLVDFLPILGTGSILIPLSLFYMMTGNYTLGIGLLILYASLIALRRIIEPKILGDAIGINALAVLVTMYMGVKLMGLVGLFLGPAILIFVKALITSGIINIQIKL